MMMNGQYFPDLRVPQAVNQGAGVVSQNASAPAVLQFARLSPMQWSVLGISGKEYVVQSFWTSKFRVRVNTPAIKQIVAAVDRYVQMALTYQVQQYRPAGATGTGAPDDPYVFNLSDTDVQAVNNPGASTSTSSGTDWAKLANTFVTAGSTAALGIFNTLSANDRAAAQQANDLAIAKLRIAAGQTSDPTQQSAIASQYSQLQQLQQLLAAQQSASNTRMFLIVGGLAVLGLGGVYLLTKKN
jgi:hypothetical protein